LIKEIRENFGERLRLRVSGILIEAEEVLMVRHKGLSEAGFFWSPPGGEVNFGESLRDALAKEFLEETGLEIAVEEFLFVNEFYHHPLHAVEVFFRVKKTGGTLQVGFDPELPGDRQIIDEVRFFNSTDLVKHQGAQIHSIFKNIEHPKHLLNLKGYFQNWK